jgi:hypothetical protein
MIISLFVKSILLMFLLVCSTKSFAQKAEIGNIYKKIQKKYSKTKKYDVKGFKKQFLKMNDSSTSEITTHVTFEVSIDKDYVKIKNFTDASYQEYKFNSVSKGHIKSGGETKVRLDLESLQKAERNNGHIGNGTISERISTPEEMVLTIQAYLPVANLILKTKPKYNFFLPLDSITTLKDTLINAEKAYILSGQYTQKPEIVTELTPLEKEQFAKHREDARKAGISERAINMSLLNEENFLKHKQKTFADPTQHTIRYFFRKKDLKILGYQQITYLPTLQTRRRIYVSYTN